MPKVQTFSNDMRGSAKDENAEKARNREGGRKYKQKQTKTRSGRQ